MSSTFLPGGFGSQYKSELASPYIFVIILSSVIFILIIILIIREILKSRGILHDCCNYKEDGIRCLTFQECCIACAQTCDCCGITSIESCFNACCPKRGSIEFAVIYNGRPDIITCEACCSCDGGGTTTCVCAPTDINNVNCLCCACEQQYPQADYDDR